MLALIGTVPDAECGLVEGEAVREPEGIRVGSLSFPVSRGTPALIAACLAAGEVLDTAPPTVFLGGDVGRGTGSRLVYRRLVDLLPQGGFSVLTFHYLQPDVDWHNRILLALEGLSPRPILIADAGFMYAAKMSGEAPRYDLFTPDAGELAFLADEEAPHPFYTRGFILHEEQKVPELIARAFRHGNAARCLLVKGLVDTVACKGRIVETVDSPSVEALEPIGGTGDTLTGIVAALVHAGWPVAKAAGIAARANRIAGALADPSPRTPVAALIDQIPRALRGLLDSAAPLHHTGK